MDQQAQRLSIFDTVGTFLGSFRRQSSGIIVPWQGALLEGARIVDVGHRTGDGLMTQVLVLRDTLDSALGTVEIPAVAPRS